MHGSPFCAATAWARRCFLTVIGKYVPPFTVASLATIMDSVPETRPMPVTIPAAGTRSPSAIASEARIARAGPYRGRGSRPAAHFRHTHARDSAHPPVVPFSGGPQADRMRAWRRTDGQAAAELVALLPLAALLLAGAWQLVVAGHAAWAAGAAARAAGRAPPPHAPPRRGARGAPPRGP